MTAGNRARHAPARPEKNPDERAVLEAALDAVITADHGGRILTFNKAAERIFGYTREAVVGRPIGETIVPPRDRARHETGFRRYVETRRPRIMGRRVELTAMRADGSEFPCELSVVCEETAPREPPRFTAFVRDLTETKRAERLLEDSERRFRALVENASDVIGVIAADGTILFQAPSVALLGYEPNDLIGRNALDFVHPDDHAGVKAALAAAAEQPGATASVEYRFRRKDGTWRLLASTGKNAIDIAGIGGIIVNSRDVTEARAVAQAQARLAAILDATPDFVGMSGLDRRPFYINRAGRRMIGIDDDEDIAAIRIQDLHTEAAGRIVAEVGVPSAVRDGFWFGETVLRSRTGEEIPVSQVIVAHRDSAGRVAHFSTICRDISERQRANAAQRRLLDVFDKAPDGYALFDPEDRLVFANRKYRELMAETDYLMVPGAAYGDILHTALAEGLIPEAAGREEEWYRARMARRRTDPTPFEVQRGQDGRWIRVREQALPDGSLFIVRTDITAEKLREAELVQAQKMEVVGQLTGGVAHDFNNLLAVIQGNLELLSEYAAKDATIGKFVAPALRAAQRGGELTQRLLAFSRRQMLRPETIDLETLVADTGELLRRTLGAAIEIETDLAPDLWLALVDANQLENALLNLALNARDAMPDGGRLTIRAYNAELGAKELVESDAAAPGAYVALVVADTGRGMSPEVMKRAYEPFFTTKSAGSGLGLSMVYGFVKQSGGHIRIDSSPGSGTAVTLYLPRAAGTAAEAPLAADRRAVPAGNGETVLVVEDDLEVRDLVVRQLGELGYRVHHAERAVAALERLTERDDIDLLLTDVVLPGGMSGIALVEAARARHPELRVLCMSGYAQDKLSPGDAAKLGISLLNKPFRRADLARAVRAALGARVAKA